VRGFWTASGVCAALQRRACSSSGKGASAGHAHDLSHLLPMRETGDLRERRLWRHQRQPHHGELYRTSGPIPTIGCFRPFGNELRDPIQWGLRHASIRSIAGRQDISSCCVWKKASTNSACAVTRFALRSVPEFARAPGDRPCAWPQSAGSGYATCVAHLVAHSHAQAR
jgi:hypothetical protein